MSPGKPRACKEPGLRGVAPSPHPSELSITLKGQSSGWSEPKALKSARGLRELELVGVLNFMPPKQSEWRGEKMPLSSELLRGVRGDGRNECGIVSEVVRPLLTSRLGVTRLV